MVRIDSRITPRSHNTRYFRRDADHRQNNFVTNESFQGCQGPPVIPAALPQVTSSNVVVTGEYEQFLQTTYPSNVIYSNTGAQRGVPHGTAHPGHVYHQLQLQQFYTSVPPFLQSFQNPEVSGWISPNTQLQPTGHNFPVWSNETVGQISTTTNPNAVSLNAVTNQSYTYNYNNVQEYNTVLM